MKTIKITVMRKARYDDLIEQYENPIEHACDIEEGQVFFCNGWKKTDGFCDSTWDSVSPFVMTLAHGGEDFYDGWMKNKKYGRKKTAHAGGLSHFSTYNPSMLMLNQSNQLSKFHNNQRNED